MHHPWKYVGGGDMVSPLEVGAMVRWAVVAALANYCVLGARPVSWGRLRRAFTMAATMMVLGANDGDGGRCVGARVGSAMWMKHGPCHWAGSVVLLRWQRR